MSAKKMFSLVQREPTPPRGTKRVRINRRLRGLSVLLIGVVSLVAIIVWIATRAAVIQLELNASLRLVPEIQEAVLRNQPELASSKAQALRVKTAAAEAAASDPLWTLASSVPLVGPNFAATTEVARTAYDVATLGISPLVTVFRSWDWSGLLPTSHGTDLLPLKKAAPEIASAAHAVSASADRLDAIEAGGLLPQVAEPLLRARSQLRAASGMLSAAGNAATIAPAMMGAEQPRRYLLLIQNNAEARASGGIPTALAVLTLDGGKLELGQQTTANELGRMDQPIKVDSEQERIYSERLGSFMQDVN